MKWSLFEKDVRAFHRRFRVPVRSRPQREIPPDERAIRIRLIREEADELIEALTSGTVADIASEAIDLLYVTFGTLASYGIRAVPIWKAIHRANMRKAPNPSGGKIQKPPGWTPADVRSLLVEQVQETRRGVGWWTMTVVGLIIGTITGFAVVSAIL